MNDNFLLSSNVSALTGRTTKCSRPNGSPKGKRSAVNLSNLFKSNNFIF